jgi:hypothetical protein
MRESGVRGVLIYCSDYKCSHHIAASADQWPDDVRLSDIEDRFVCKACGKRGADIRSDFHWQKARDDGTESRCKTAPNPQNGTTQDK